MLYFDWYSDQRFGSIRQQIWTILHFPFHLSLVLFLEGAAEFIIFRKIIEILIYINTTMSNEYFAWANDPQGSLLDLQQALNASTSSIFGYFAPQNEQTYIEVRHIFKVIDLLNSVEGNNTANSDATKAAVESQVTSLLLTIQNSLFQTYGIDAPHSQPHSITLGSSDQLINQTNNNLVQQVETAQDTNNQYSYIFELVVSHFHPFHSQSSNI